MYDTNWMLQLEIAIKVAIAAVLGGLVGLEIRVVEALVTGVGFLGAGTIFRDGRRGSIEGLTTAAIARGHDRGGRRRPGAAARPPRDGIRARGAARLIPAPAPATQLTARPTAAPTAYRTAFGLALLAEDGLIALRAVAPRAEPHRVV